MDPALEALVDLYKTSVGSELGGTPEELIQGATSIPSNRSAVTMHGPANCTEENEHDDAPEGDPDAACDSSLHCAAALNGGLDDVEPVRIWNAIMQNYKVAHVCGQEIACLNVVNDKSEIEKLKQQEAVAVARAVTHLAALNEENVKAKLLEVSKHAKDSGEVITIAH